MAAWPYMSREARRYAIALAAECGLSPETLAKQRLDNTAAPVVLAIIQQPPIPVGCSELASNANGVASEQFVSETPDGSTERELLKARITDEASQSEIEKAPRREPVEEMVPRRPRRNVAVPQSLRVELLDLRDEHCRFPDGAYTDPAKTYCGHPAWTRQSASGIKIGPYCEAHSALAYQSSNQMSERDGRDAS